MTIYTFDYSKIYISDKKVKFYFELLKKSWRNYKLAKLILLSSTNLTNH